MTYIIETRREQNLNPTYDPTNEGKQWGEKYFSVVLLVFIMLLLFWFYSFLLVLSEM